MVFTIDTAKNYGSDRGTSQSETIMDISFYDDKDNLNKCKLSHTDMGNNAEYESFIETEMTQNENILMALCEFFDDNWDVSKLIGKWFEYDYETETIKETSKRYKFPVRYDIFNPFLFNPIRAVINDPNNFHNLIEFQIGHVFQTDKGLVVTGRWHGSDKDTQYPFHDGTMRIANQHEADRFEAMLKMVRISL